MLFIEYPGSERLAWDGAALYVASDTGWCSRLLPHRSDIVGGKNRHMYSNHLFEAKGDSVLVGRTLTPEAAGSQTARGFRYPLADRFVRRGAGLLSSIGPIYLEDSRLLGAEFTFGEERSFDQRFDQAALWDDTHVLVANRGESLLFDLDGNDHPVSPFFLETGNGRRRLGRPSDRGVLQVLADPCGGVLAMLEGGTLARVTFEDGEAVLRPTRVLRSDWAVWACQVTETRALFLRRGGRALLVDRATNAELCGVPLGARVPTLHPGGRIIAVADRNRLTIGPVESPDAVHSFEVRGGPIRHLAFAPDGLTVAAATDQGVTLLDVA